MNLPIESPFAQPGRRQAPQPTSLAGRVEDMDFELPEPARPHLPRLVAIGLLTTLIVTVLFLARLLPEKRARQALWAETQMSQNARVRVNVVRPVLASSSRALSLPGSVQPLQETTLFPRASGYVRKWLVDIGDRVRAGEVLAEIDTPELEQQLKQARAQLEQLKASLVQARASDTYSKQTLQRYEALTPAGVASEQDLEKQRAQTAVDTASVTVANANVDAQRANIERLARLKSFARVLAPFDGIVTMRAIDIGSLVTSGNNSPLFKVTATDPVRVFVQVPQDAAPTLHPNVPATVTVREYPGRNFLGKVTRTAGALDPATRTMTTEVRVPNPDNELLTGMYAQVSFNLPAAHKVYEIPATALRDDATGLRVAVVDDNETLHLVPVVIDRDTGSTLQIASGLDGSESVVQLMRPELAEGLRVVADNVVHGPQ